MWGKWKFGEGLGDAMAAERVQLLRGNLVEMELKDGQFTDHQQSCR
jgi:hypothetical protein